VNEGESDPGLAAQWPHVAAIVRYSDAPLRAAGDTRWGPESAGDQGDPVRWTTAGRRVGKIDEENGEGWKDSEKKITKCMQ
jgi:hypothetical protein